jgi:hypothetical protein
MAADRIYCSALSIPTQLFTKSFLGSPTTF